MPRTWTSIQTLGAANCTDWPGKARYALMAMFSVYFDASKDRHERILSIGGFIATVEQWEEFQREWCALLKTGPVSMMHATDLENLYGEFKGWSFEKKLQFQKIAYGIIRRRVEVGIAASVTLDAYEKEMTGDYRVTHGGPYAFCFRIALTRIREWAIRFNRTEPMNYIVESGDLGIQEAHDVFTHTLHGAPKVAAKFLFGTWAEADKRKVVQLQAADVIAYEQTKHMVNRVKDGEIRAPRKSLLALLDGKLWLGGHYDAEAISKYKASINLDDPEMFPDMAQIRKQRSAGQ
jgi:hypothetical protein